LASASARQFTNVLPVRGSQQEQEEIDVVKVQFQRADHHQSAPCRMAADLLADLLQLLCIPGCQTDEDGDAALVEGPVDVRKVDREQPLEQPACQPGQDPARQEHEEEMTCSAHVFLDNQAHHAGDQEGG
jgi:hypothetical protein